MSLRIEMGEGIGRLILDDPPLNLLTRASMFLLREGLDELAANPDLRVVILTAEGPNFSAGASVPEHLPPEFEEMIPEFTATILRLLDFPLPLLAAVRGRCLGGGFEVALTADVLLAGEGALLGAPEIRLGVFPPAVCALLEERVPPGVVAELLYTGDPLDAGAARAAGLVHRVVPDGELDSAALELAGRIALNSGAALRAAKEARLRPRRGGVEARLQAAEAVYLTEAMATADAEEGLRSFMEKRSPVWSHR